MTLMPGADPQFAHFFSGDFLLRFDIPLPGDQRKPGIRTQVEVHFDAVVAADLTGVSHLHFFFGYSRFP